MYYCGWDGGGSKTKAFALASNGEKIGEAVFGPLNLNGENLETVEKTVHDGVRWMAQLPGGLEGCRGLVAGMAGVSNRQAVQMVEAAMHTSGYAGSFRLLGDHEIALEGAIEGPGAILIAGTGAVCYGRDREGEHLPHRRIRLSDRRRRQRLRPGPRHPDGGGARLRRARPGYLPDRPGVSGFGR